VKESKEGSNSLAGCLRKQPRTNFLRKMVKEMNRKEKENEYVNPKTNKIDGIVVARLPQQNATVACVPIEGFCFAPSLSVDLTVNKSYYSCFDENSKRTQTKGHIVRSLPQTVIDGVIK
jgi:hypothetical protein